jgi:hypothetical protein
MTDPAKRERAALDVLALLHEWWAVGPTSYDPGIGRWSYTARGPHPGRGKYPETITGTGEDELAAMPRQGPGAVVVDLPRPLMDELIRLAVREDRDIVGQARRLVAEGIGRATRADR